MERRVMMSGDFQMDDIDTILTDPMLQNRADGACLKNFLQSVETGHPDAQSTDIKAVDRNSGTCAKQFVSAMAETELHPGEPADI